MKHVTSEPQNLRADVLPSLLSLFSSREVTLETGVILNSHVLS